MIIPNNVAMNSGAVCAATRGFLRLAQNVSRAIATSVSQSALMAFSRLAHATAKMLSMIRNF
jgi:sulfur relay (sulfurtransferase) complex TusBCD TusD component (DsrE family)